MSLHLSCFPACLYLLCFVVFFLAIAQLCLGWFPPPNFLSPQPFCSTALPWVMPKTPELNPPRPVHSSNGHSSCLRESPIPSKCKVCTGSKGRFHKDREVRLKCLPMEHSLAPSRCNSLSLYISFNLSGCTSDFQSSRVGSKDQAL